MIRQYKLRELNKTPELHNNIFVKYKDCLDMLELFINSAIEAGADREKLMAIVEGEVKDE